MWCWFLCRIKSKRMRKINKNSEAYRDHLIITADLELYVCVKWAGGIVFASQLWRRQTKRKKKCEEKEAAGGGTRCKMHCEKKGRKSFSQLFSCFVVGGLCRDTIKLFCETVIWHQPIYSVVHSVSSGPLPLPFASLCRYREDIERWRWLICVCGCVTCLGAFLVNDWSDYRLYQHFFQI